MLTGAQGTCKQQLDLFTQDIKDIMAGGRPRLVNPTAQFLREENQRQVDEIQSYFTHICSNDPVVALREACEQLKQDVKSGEIWKKEKKMELAARKYLLA